MTPLNILTAPRSEIDNKIIGRWAMMLEWVNLAHLISLCCFRASSNLEFKERWRLISSKMWISKQKCQFVGLYNFFINNIPFVKWVVPIFWCGQYIEPLSERTFLFFACYYWFIAESTRIKTRNWCGRHASYKFQFMKRRWHPLAAVKVDGCQIRAVQTWSRSATIMVVPMGI